MDAPTTTSADNGTSGGNGGGGWFTPRKPPTQGRSAPSPSTPDDAAGGGEGAGGAGDGGERIAGPRRPVASIRPVGSGASRPAPPPRGVGPAAAPPESDTPRDGDTDGDTEDNPPIGHTPHGRASIYQDHMAAEPEAVQEVPGPYAAAARHRPPGLRVVPRPDTGAGPRTPPDLHLVTGPSETGTTDAAPSPRDVPSPREAPAYDGAAGADDARSPHEASARREAAEPEAAAGPRGAAGPDLAARAHETYAADEVHSPSQGHAGHEAAQGSPRFREAAQGEPARSREDAARLREASSPYAAHAGHKPAQGEAPHPHEAAGPGEARSFGEAIGHPEAHSGAPTAHDLHDLPQSAAAPADDASPDAILIRRTMAEIAPVADKVTSYFYALLFVRHPELRDLFPAAMDSQRDRLLKALLTAAEHMDNAAVLTDYLQHLGRGHRKYGTQPEHYPAVGEALIGALTRYATSTWDEETEAAWIRTYTTISQIMIDAAAENERKAPAWWHGEVVSHDLRTPDIAIITVRPDQPYAFLAGQYTSLETPWWPRIWRHYSFAGAPRSDGLLSFHVKAVPAGWVSNALVHHARPGDVLRLGPPAGSMTVDHTTDNGLLCLGGGTGIAPIKALVEDVAEHGARRPVEVFYGARTDYDLYDIDTMLRLQQTHPWLHVRPVVDGRAQFPDAVREYGPWYEYDAYLSGPPGMIRSGVSALRGIGIPSDRIRHDSLEELVAAGD
jgi:ferredoxin-NADP reductase/hemoglobin-like flavoprotein